MYIRWVLAYRFLTETGFFCFVLLSFVILFMTSLMRMVERSSYWLFSLIKISFWKATFMILQIKYVRLFIMSIFSFLRRSLRVSMRNRKIMDKRF